MASAIDSSATKGHKSEKKSKKERKEKKRLREEDAEAGEEPRHKRSKSVGVTHDDDDNDRANENGDSLMGSQDLSLSGSTPSNTAEAVANGEPSLEKKRKQKKDKQKKSTAEAEEEGDGSDAERKEKKEKKTKKQKSQQKDVPDNGLTDDAEPASEKKDKKKSKKSKAAVADDVDAMDVDSPAKETTTTAAAAATTSTSRFHQPPDAPSKPQFPFYTQTVSLYLPIYPVGWDTPCTAAASQHLEPLLNRYVPDFKGVLLAFRNVALSERPGRRHAATTDTERCDLISVDEYAVGFGYVTVDVDLFVPRRGAWMEGSINLENEGHIGVVCWGKFNASIESARLPPEWRWVHANSAEAEAYANDPFAEEEAEVEGEREVEQNHNAAESDAAAKDNNDDEHGAVRQIHSTGFWVDGDGEKVKGRIRFRIKAFDVGVSGDHGYLSLEGTMLDAAGEMAAVKRDAEQERRRRAGKSGYLGGYGGASGSILAKERRRMPEFSVTNFGVVEDEEDKALRRDVWDKTAPVTEADEGGDKQAVATFAGIAAEEE